MSDGYSRMQREEFGEKENLSKDCSVNPDVKITYSEFDQSQKEVRKLTLPTDSNERKNYPLLSGLLKYFPAALAGVSNTSKVGNDKHNAGQPLHHARWKSMDHGDCILRHLMDTEDLLAAMNRGDKEVDEKMVLTEVNQLVWRALAYSQLIHESFGAPLAPGAKLDDSK